MYKSSQEIKDSDVKEIKDIIKQLNHLELI
jgi:hypothetical protein